LYVQSEKILEGIYIERVERIRSQKKGNEIVLVAEGIVHSLNAGTIMRSADCFGLDRVIFFRPKKKYNSERMRTTSRGAESWVETYYCHTMEELEKEIGRHKWVVLETTGEVSLESLIPQLDNFSIAFFVGSEGSGISEDVMTRADFVTKIRMRGKTPCLNVGVAASVAMYEARRFT
jgi:tRNA G18 (ribose-2'-O)-methylase SpoU